jgi:hypothetical protein
MRTVVALTAPLALALGCSPDPSPVVTTPSYDPPLSLQLEAVDPRLELESAHRRTLTMTVGGRAGLADRPIAIGFELPPGVALVDPAFATRPARLGERRKVELRIDPPGEPASDLVAVASLHGDGFGAVARRAYRFGRPEPKLVVPRPPLLRLGGGPRQ